MSTAPRANPGPALNRWSGPKAQTRKRGGNLDCDPRTLTLSPTVGEGIITRMKPWSVPGLPGIKKNRKMPPIPGLM